jgi:hypothetical protein
VHLLSPRATNLPEGAAKVVLEIAANTMESWNLMVLFGAKNRIIHRVIMIIFEFVNCIVNDQ